MTHADMLESSASDATLESAEPPIVVALKPFERGEGTIGMARWIAQRRGAPLHGVSVLEPTDVGSAVAGLPMMPELYGAREQEEVVVDAHARFMRVDEAMRATVEVVQGAPSSSVCHVAQDRNAPMIVIGTGRHGMLGRFVHGERAIDIVRNATTTVLIVPPGAEPPIRRAMVAVDFSPASLRAAVATLELLGPGGHLSLVHVESAVHHTDGRSAPMMEEQSRITRGLLARFVEALPVSVTQPLRLDTAIIRGDAVGALLQYAEQHGFQLLACGRNRHPLLHRLFVGSVSAALIRGASCSVLIATERPPEDSDGHEGVRETVSSTDPAEWRALLQHVTERNAGRRARLSLAATSVGGVQSVENGYVLLSIDYDRRGARADITLGDPHAMGSHLTHRITGLRRVETEREHDGHEARVRFDARSGQCTIDFAHTAGEGTIADSS